MNKGGLVTYATFFLVLVSTTALCLVPSYWKIPLILLQGLSILRCFCLMHELGHGNMFRKRNANDYWGLVMSLFCVTPYYSWKYVHQSHHIWAGYKDLDPTEDELEFKNLSAMDRFVANISWKLWLPLLSFIFSLKTFWNISKLKSYYGEEAYKIKRIRFGIFALLLLHLILITLFGWAYFVHFFAGFMVFLFFMDPISISQHIGIEHHHSEGKKVIPFKSEEQNIFARTIIFPHWFSKHILLGFNYHSAHHEQPRIPGYDLGKLKNIPPTHQQHWLEWIKEFKTKKLEHLL